MTDYLFDRDGAPDPEVERLERLLAPLALGEPRPLPLPERPRVSRRRPMVIAATLLAAAAAVALFLRSPRWIETGANSVRLQVTTIGTVELEPNTRARLVGEHVELARGAVSARIDAPPRRFVVETRSLKVIDLGCAFRVTVDESGRGQVSVSEGRVVLAGGGAGEVVLAAGEARAFDENGAAEPAHVEPAHVEPAHVEPVHVEPAHVEPVHVAPKLKLAAPRSVHHSAPNVAPQQNSPTPKPATKSAPDPRFSHDSLKDLDRSLP
jgi:ferric-dicitrate binding protein FerR (iron transport regulator)